MAKIVTVTLNTAIDHCIALRGLGIEETIQAESSAEYLCGKGLNVARGLAALDAQVHCLGFVGEQSAARFQQLDTPGLDVDLLAVAGTTRSNITLFDRSTGSETHIRTSGYSVLQKDCDRLTDQMNCLLSAGDMVVFSGSLPPGAPVDFYQSLINLCHSKGAKSVLDSSGEGLRHGVDAAPWLIKPNLAELETLAGKALEDEPAIINQAKHLTSQGCQWVVVSRGAEGVLAVSREHCWKATVSSVPGQIMTHVGCGDALVAGWVYATLRAGQGENWVQYGVACAVANLFYHEPGRFSQRDVDRLLPLIDITKIIE